MDQQCADIEKAISDLHTDLSGQITALDTKVTTTKSTLSGLITAETDKLETKITDLDKELQDQLDALDIPAVGTAVNQAVDDIETFIDPKVIALD